MEVASFSYTSVAQPTSTRCQHARAMKPQTLLRMFGQIQLTSTLCCLPVGSFQLLGLISDTFWDRLCETYCNVSAFRRVQRRGVSCRTEGETVEGGEAVTRGRSCTLRKGKFHNRTHHRLHKLLSCHEKHF